MVCTAGSVLAHCPTEFGHGHEHHVVTISFEICPESGNRIGEILGSARKGAPLGALPDVSVPTPGVRKRDFESNIGP